MTATMQTLTPHSTGMDWDEIERMIAAEREDHAHEIAASILRGGNPRQPVTTGPEYWRLVRAAREGFDARGGLGA